MRHNPFDGATTSGCWVFWANRSLLRLKKKKRKQLGSMYICLTDEVRQSRILKIAMESKSYIPMHENP